MVTNLLKFNLSSKLNSKLNNNNILICTLESIFNCYIFNIEKLVQHDFQLYYQYNYD